MASSGFESTVRLAKSHPSMWVPIFMQNKESGAGCIERTYRTIDAVQRKY
jgi:prephenate dehydrogenase